MSTGYCRIQPGLFPRSTGESSLSWSYSGEDHASGKTLSCLNFAALPVHGQIYESPGENLFQVNGRSFCCQQDHASEACLSDWSGCRLHLLQYYLSQVDSACDGSHSHRIQPHRQNYTLRRETFVEDNY